MEFSWSKTETSLFESTVDFANECLIDDVIDRDIKSEFSQDHWAKCANHGILRWGVPQSYGGQEYDPLLCAYLMEALGYGCSDNGLLFALGTQLWGIQKILLQFANESQRETYLRPMLDGSMIGAYAINEPNSGSDAFALQTKAEKTSDGYVLNGKKTLISMSHAADFAIVFAMTNPAAGRWGISAFLVDTKTPGIELHDHEPMMGLRTVPFGSLTLNDCIVPESALLGTEGNGVSIFNFTQCWERSLMLAPQLGAMSRILDQCVEQAKSRNRGGQAIGKHQAISSRIANMRINLETCRLLQYKSAWMLSQGKQNLMEAAITKVHISEAFVNTATEAIAIFGGDGYLSNQGIERHLRDAIGGTIHGGTVDMQRNIIAGLLGL